MLVTAHAKFYFQLLCVVPENINPPTTERIGNSEWVRGQRARNFWRGGGIALSI